MCNTERGHGASVVPDLSACARVCVAEAAKIREAADSVSYVYTTCNQKCADLLFMITKLSTTKWAYTDSSTSSYNITRHTRGGILLCEATNLLT